MMRDEQPTYIAYLLRLWRVPCETLRAGGTTADTWHASLESPGTGNQVGFASLFDLFAFLEHETVGYPVPSPGDDGRAKTDDHECGDVDEITGVE